MVKFDRVWKCLERRVRDAILFEDYLLLKVIISSVMIDGD